MLDEDDETVIVTLTGATNATLDEDAADLTATGTISDDDATPTLSVNDVSVVEGGKAAFTVTLSAASGRAVSFRWKTANATGAAAAGAGDYTAVGTLQTVTIAAGSTTAAIEVETTQDTLDEPAETFLVQLSAATNATIADGEGTGTITDNDAVPTLSVNDAAVAEGGKATFTVRLSAVSGRAVTFKWKTAADTGAAAAGATDYTAVGETTVTIAAGSTTAAIEVQTTQDTLDEADETFLVELSAPTNATLADGEGEGTITDDDGTPTLSVADAAAAEGGKVAFTVELSAASGKDVTFSWKTAPDEAEDAHAAAATDYTAVPATTVTIDAGDRTATLEVETTQDAIDEHDETFTVELSAATNATIADGEATGTISDDDAATAVVSVGAPGAAVTEGNDPAKTTNLSFPVSLTAASGKAVTVTYTLTGTARAPGDYTEPDPLSVSVPAGSTTASIVVPVRGTCSTRTTRP